MESLYASGFYLYQGGKYEEAVHYFKTLTLTEPFGKRNWVGLGSSYQMLEEYEKAAQAYAFAANLDEEDPYPHLHAAECLFSMGKPELAQEALRAAEAVAVEQKTKDRISCLRLSWIKTEESNDGVQYAH